MKKYLRGLVIFGLIVTLAGASMTTALPARAASNDWKKIGMSLGQQNFDDVAMSATGQYMATALGPGYVYTSNDYGATWTERASVGFELWAGITMSSDGSKLAVIDKPGKVHTSTDYGATWTERTSVAFRPWEWIAGSADGNTLLITADASSSMGGVAYSTDAGATWTELDEGDFGPVAVSDDGTHLTYYDPQADAMIMSSDSGDTWDEVYDVAGYVTGVDLSADGSKMIVLDSAGANMAETDVLDWTTVQPTTDAKFDVVMDTTGNKIAIAASGTYGIYTSSNFGSTWTPGANTNGLDLRGVVSSDDGSRLFASGTQRLWVNEWSVVFEDYDGNGAPDQEQPNISTYASPVTGKRVVLDVGEDCAITTDDVLPQDTLADKDAGYSFANGLFDFAGDCGDPGFSKTIKLYYYGVDEDNLVLRKYDPATKAFTTLTADHQVSISKTTINGQVVTVASYQIVDGGDLDLDHEVNGEFEDPIGLAASIVNVPSTGLN